MVVILVILAVLILGAVECAGPIPLIWQGLTWGTLIFLVTPHLLVVESRGRYSAVAVFLIEVIGNKDRRALRCLTRRESIELYHALDATGMVSDADGLGSILRTIAVNTLLEVPEIYLLAVRVLVVCRHGR